MPSENEGGESGALTEHMREWKKKRKSKGGGGGGRNEWGGMGGQMAEVMPG